jgi:hypothetical protein
MESAKPAGSNKFGGTSLQRRFVNDPTGLSIVITLPFGTRNASYFLE